MKGKGPTAGWLEVHLVNPIIRGVAAVVGRHLKSLKKQIEDLRLELLKELGREEAAEDPEDSAEHDKAAQKAPGKAI